MWLLCAVLERHREVYTSELFSVVGDAVAGTAPSTGAGLRFSTQHGLRRIAEVCAPRIYT